MEIKETINFIGDNIKQVFRDIKEDVEFTIDNFKAAKGKEKAWVLFKTYCVALACGIIALAATAIGGVPGIGPFLAGFVVGGTVAFYRFAQAANGLPTQQLANGVRRFLNDGVNAVAGVVNGTARGDNRNQRIR